MTTSRTREPEMKVFESLPLADTSMGAPKVTLGTFDGVHLGHQAVLRQLLAWARATDTPAVALTFDRKPRHALAWQSPELITSLRHRLRLIEEIGLDATIVMRFDERLARTPAEEFVREVLVGQLKTSGVLLGHDTRFGRGGHGDFQLMSRLGEALGFEVCSTEVVSVDGEPVSSTRVREAICARDIATVEKLLGRRMSLLGAVVAGARRGRDLGFPTANLDVHHEVRPPEGVYVTWSYIDGARHGSVTNVGRVPTFRRADPAHRSDSIVVETHLLDYDGDLFGKEVEIEFIRFLRPEIVFRSAADLAEQIGRDVQCAQSMLDDLKG